MKTLCVAVKKRKKYPISEYWNADYVETSEFNFVIIAEHKKYFSKCNFVLNCLGAVWKQLWIWEWNYQYVTDVSDTLQSV